MWAPTIPISSSRLLLPKKSSSFLNLGRVTRCFPTTNFTSSQTQLRDKSISSPSSSSYSSIADDRKEDVVIVGGGIAGLATALGLHRLGIRSLVLEQSDSLRASGASITLSKNAWTALDELGVGNQLRSHFLELQRLEMKTDEGEELGSLKFKDVNQSQEIRAVERRILMQTLSGQLPADILQFSSKLEKIEKDEGTGETILQLVNGDKLSSKIVVGCDGIHSPIARWMGFSEPKYVGHCVFRGLAVYPNGHPYQPAVNYFYGRGLRAVFVPMSTTKLFWSIIYNSTSSGPTVTDPSVLKQQALDLVKNWPTDLPNIVDITSEEDIFLSPLKDRWLWPLFTPPVSKGGVVLAGDAWHPMTPNLGQGGCCALEDAVLLASKLGGAMKHGQGSIEDALKSYGDERWPNVFPITIISYLVGAFLQSPNPVVCSIRNNFVLSKLFRFVQRVKTRHSNFGSKPM